MNPEVILSCSHKSPALPGLLWVLSEGQEITWVPGRGWHLGEKGATLEWFSLESWKGQVGFESHRVLVRG